MELAIIFLGVIYAFIAWAPKEATQTMLTMAWGAMALFAIVPLIYGLFGLLF